MGKYAFGITGHEYLGLNEEADHVRMLTASSNHLFARIVQIWYVKLKLKI